VFTPTSEVLPPAQFPQFASHGSADYATPPVEGSRYAAALHADDSYMRLTRTLDLSGADSAELGFQLHLSSEEGYDHLIVEARTPGQDNWTTLPEAGGATTTDPPTECEVGFLLELHPFLGHYLGGPDCTQPGTSGVWNSITGSTGGWQDVAFDLSDYAGQQVEVSIAYVTDPGTGGVGAFVDDTRVTVDGVESADGLEEATSAWTVGGPPAESPPNSGNWQIGEKVDVIGGTSTEDTLLLGFGLEQLETPAQRADIVERALDGLID
jgi:hypothetical protein